MLRNLSPSTLQKAYDECYMSCSTAVYFEREGNEQEALQYWKRGLDQMNEYHATRTFNSNPRSETEKELLKSLRDLEMQCKERIDLLEALRISRSDTDASPAPRRSGTWYEGITQRSERGFIGGGTIPAISYPDLARPALPQRPSAQSRTSSERAVVGATPLRSSLELLTPYSKPSPIPYASPTPVKQSRSNSPDKQQHVMRTTLRTGKPGERSKLMRRRPSQAPAEGPGASKAATIAWSKEGPVRRAPLDIDTLPILNSMANNTSSSEILPRRVSGPASLQWDSHSRRLVASKEVDSNVASQRTSKGDKLDSITSSRPSVEEHSSQGPSKLSISAASSALNNHYSGDSQGSDPEVGRASRAPRQIPSKSPACSRTSRHHDLPRSPKCSPREATERRASSLDLQIRRKAIGSDTAHTAKPSSSKLAASQKTPNRQRRSDSSSSREDAFEGPRTFNKKRSYLKEKEKEHDRSLPVQSPTTKTSEEGSDEEDLIELKAWKKRKAQILKNLPAGVDAAAAKQILNEIVVKGDEVHWDDIAGLDVAKAALRETVVYPFLRPDLFMGLREPARGMLLFGPPGTGKTMLARAVATESASTFFSISASSLTSKYLGESEKLVRALFALAKQLAPSIIFVDEIDSLLSQRSGSGEHEATRRIKTEFLIQWSDLQRAAAGRDVSDRDKERGDANRVLVLAATNLPWAIDEAARRRFVRRQYIPLPEAETRKTQVETLLAQQKHNLSDYDIEELVRGTEGFSGSDITALAKDAAMGPLRSLGEAVLTMKMDEIRPMGLEDFQASLKTIRPSVGKEGLKEYEDWARTYGERGG